MSATTDSLLDVLEGQIEKRKAKLTKPRGQKWEPRNWKPEYEKVVLLSINATNLEIAAITGYTKEHISNILNTPQAMEIKDKLILAMRNKAMVEDVNVVLARLNVKTLKRVEEMLDSDDIFNKSPFSVVDRGLKITAGLGHLKDSGNAGINFNGPVAILPSEAANQLAAGLNLANQVKARLTEGRQISEVPVEIIEKKDDKPNK